MPGLFSARRVSPPGSGSHPEAQSPGSLMPGAAGMSVALKQQLSPVTVQGARDTEPVALSSGPVQHHLPLSRLHCAVSPWGSVGGSGPRPGREGRAQSWRRDQPSRPASDRLDCASVQRHSVFMSPVWVSAACGTVATEDGVCGCCLNICRYLNRRHQSSFTELNLGSVQMY